MGSVRHRRDVGRGDRLAERICSIAWPERSVLAIPVEASDGDDVCLVGNDMVVGSFDQ